MKRKPPTPPPAEPMEVVGVAEIHINPPAMFRDAQPTTNKTLPTTVKSPPPHTEATQAKPETTISGASHEPESQLIAPASEANPETTRSPALEVQKKVSAQAPVVKPATSTYVDSTQVVSSKPSMAIVSLTTPGDEQETSNEEIGHANTDSNVIVEQPEKSNNISGDTTTVVSLEVTSEKIKEELKVEKKSLGVSLSSPASCSALKNDRVADTDMIVEGEENNQVMVDLISSSDEGDHVKRSHPLQTRSLPDIAGSETKKAQTTNDSGNVCDSEMGESVSVSEISDTKATDLSSERSKPCGAAELVREKSQSPARKEKTPSPAVLRKSRSNSIVTEKTEGISVVREKTPSPAVLRKIRASSIGGKSGGGESVGGSGGGSGTGSISDIAAQGILEDGGASTPHTPQSPSCTKPPFHPLRRGSSDQRGSESSPHRSMTPSSPVSAPSSSFPNSPLSATPSSPTATLPTSCIQNPSLLPTTSLDLATTQAQVPSSSNTSPLPKVTLRALPSRRKKHGKNSDSEAPSTDSEISNTTEQNCGKSAKDNNNDDNKDEEKPERPRSFHELLSSFEPDADRLWKLQRTRRFASEEMVLSRILLNQRYEPQLSPFSSEPDLTARLEDAPTIEGKY